MSFQDIDGQLDMILSGELSEVRLPKELASTEHKFHALKEAMEKRLLYTINAKTKSYYFRRCSKWISLQFFKQFSAGVFQHS